jgi:hypothetical protein
VGAKLRAAQERSVATGWYAGAFGGQKRLKPLAHYLKPPQTPEQRRAEGVEKVRALFERFAPKPDGQPSPTSGAEG